MCYDALIEGDEGKSYGTLLREELPDAVTDGLVVAAVVLVVLAANAVAPTLTLGAAVAGFVLGVVVHQVVLVVGVSLRRFSAPAAGRSPTGRDSV